MKKVYKRILTILTAVMLFAVSVMPTFAATREVAINRVSFPTTLTVYVGETKTLSISTAPSNATYKTSIEWGCQANGAISYKVNGYGTYWNGASSENITGLKPGKAYLFNTVKVYDSNKKYITKYDVRTTVTVLARTQTTNNNNSSSSKKTANTKVALKSIKLNVNALSLTAGESTKLSVSFNPTNTTDSKNVSWSTSNSSIATVSGGNVTAKKAGTATITAKCNGKTATCRVTVKAPQKTAINDKNNNKGSSTTTSVSAEKYWNVSDAYTVLNNFRTNKNNQWYWNSDNKTKITVYGLKSLRRDVTLENIAKNRAKEQWTQYYVNGKATHDRLNGKNCWTAYTAGSNPCGENLAWGQRSSSEAITEPYWGWAETYDKYSGQGHRRNMLNPKATRVGIACYEKNGKTCWAMCLGY